MYEQILYSLEFTWRKRGLFLTIYDFFLLSVFLYSDSGKAFEIVKLLNFRFQISDW